VSESDRAAPARARSSNVAYLVPSTWAEIAARVAPLVARVDHAAAGPQVLVLVPSESDATELGRALAALPAAAGSRIAPVATPRRAKRLVATEAPHVLIGTPAAVSALIAASAVRLEHVAGVVVAAADDLERDAALVEQVLAEIPRDAARHLTAATATEFVERLLTAYMHGARRILPTEAVAAAGHALPIEVRVVSAGAAATGLGEVMEDVDAPSVAVVAADERHAAAVRDELATLGLGGAAFVREAADGQTQGAALAILVGAPTSAVVDAVYAAAPARIVALCTVRERATLASRGYTVGPWRPAATLADAAQAEEARREELRRVLRGGLPTREMLALEPLLADYDALAIAGAALALLDRTRESARREAPARPKPDRAPREAPRDDRGPRPPRDRDDRGPRMRDRDDRPPRSRDRDDRGPRPRGDRDSRGPRFDRGAGGGRPFNRDRRPPGGRDRDSRPPRPPRRRDD
jgi:hypothetical protein